MITLDLSNGAARKPATARGISDLPGLRPFLARARKAVPVAGEVSVLLTSDREIRRLNRTFRRKDAATDVLSFPAPDFSGNLSGDLAISLDTASRQAKQFRHSLQVELKILLLHGLLHLAGFDHESDAGEMAAQEDRLRRRFRLPCALIARSSGPAAAPPRRRTR